MPNGKEIRKSMKKRLILDELIDSGRKEAVTGWK